MKYLAVFFLIMGTNFAAPVSAQISETEADQICKKADPKKNPNRALLCEMRARQKIMNGTLTDIQTKVDHIDTTQIGGLAASIQSIVTLLNTFPATVNNTGTEGLSGAFTNLSTQIRALPVSTKGAVFVDNRSRAMPCTELGSSGPEKCKATARKLCQGMGYSNGTVTHSSGLTLYTFVCHD